MGRTSTSASVQGRTRARFLPSPSGSRWEHLDAVFQVLALYAETRWEHKELLLLSAGRRPGITDVAAAGNEGSPENGAPTRNQQLRPACFQEAGVLWEVLVAGD